MSRGPKGVSRLNRFLGKVEPMMDDRGCWEWMGHITAGGYGWFRADKGSVFAHRFSYESLVGIIPEGLEIDHLCRNRSCVNPAHLEPVTHLENLQRYWNLVPRAIMCKRGLHTLTDEFIQPNGGRRCVPCYKAHQKSWWKKFYQKRREMRNAT